ncbi:MAG: hypothetical protein HEQ32_08845 [Vampirovibrio sp.]
MSNFVKILDHMEDLLLGSTSVPFTPWVMVNADRLLPLMDRLREHLPMAIKEAQRLTESQDLMIEDARQQAIQLLQNAQHDRQRLLSESELMHAIQDEAQRIRAQMISELNLLKEETQAQCEALKQAAEEEAQWVRHSAKDYAADLLSTMEERLGDLHQQVRTGVQELSESQSLAEPSSSHRLLAQQPPMTRRAAKRQPRPKVASQQLPLMPQQSSPEDQIQMALQLLQSPRR